MKSAVVCSANNNAQASFGRPFCHASHSSVISVADVGIPASVFCGIIRIWRVIIIKIKTKIQDMRMLRINEFRII